MYQISERISVYPQQPNRTPLRKKHFALKMDGNHLTKDVSYQGNVYIQYTQNQIRGVEWIISEIKSIQMRRMDAA